MGVFKMPSLGADMEAGKLVEWLVQPGDTVKRGDVVAVVETQKGAIEIEIFEEGTVGRLDAELGVDLPVGAPLALILGEGEAAPPVIEPVPSRNRRPTLPLHRLLHRPPPPRHHPYRHLRPHRPAHSPFRLPRVSVPTNWASILRRSKAVAPVA